MNKALEDKLDSIEERLMPGMAADQERILYELRSIHDEMYGRFDQLGPIKTNQQSILQNQQSILQKLEVIQNRLDKMEKPVTSGS